MTTITKGMVEKFGVRSAAERVMMELIGVECNKHAIGEKLRQVLTLELEEDWFFRCRLHGEHVFWARRDDLASPVALTNVALWAAGLSWEKVERVCKEGAENTPKTTPVVLLSARDYEDAVRVQTENPLAAVVYCAEGESILWLTPGGDGLYLFTVRPDRGWCKHMWCLGPDTGSNPHYRKLFDREHSPKIVDEFYGGGREGV